EARKSALARPCKCPSTATAIKSPMASSRIAVAGFAVRPTTSQRRKAGSGRVPRTESTTSLSGTGLRSATPLASSASAKRPAMPAGNVFDAHEQPGGAERSTAYLEVPAVVLAAEAHAGSFRLQCCAQGMESLLLSLPAFAPQGHLRRPERGSSEGATGAPRSQA